jgi:hypothetical protein
VGIAEFSTVELFQVGSGASGLPFSFSLACIFYPCPSVISVVQLPQSALRGSRQDGVSGGRGADVEDGEAGFRLGRIIDAEGS